MIKRLFISKLSKKANSLTEEISYDRAHTVGILCIHEFEDQMNRIALEFSNEGKRPRLVSFVENPIKGKIYSNQSYTSKDFSVNGTIISGELSFFTKQIYDFLICIDPTGNSYIKYLLSKTQARHRIGLYHPNFENQLDMMIKPGSEDAVGELMRYVKMIKK